MIQKFKLKSNKNAYLQIDFAFALIVFLIFFILVYGYYANYKVDLKENNEILYLESVSKDICFLLINSQGSLSNWSEDINNTNYFGFKDSNSNNLNSSKFLSFNNDTYFTIIDKMNISSNLGIKIQGVETQNIYLDFGYFADDISVLYSNNLCFANYNSEIVKVFVEVWK